jgi:hypothetical protein
MFVASEENLLAILELTHANELTESDELILKSSA